MLFRFLALVAILVCSSLAQPVFASEPVDRPNIVWLSTEDIGPHLGCYDCDVKTPGLDAFAKRSLTYDVAWSNYPVCAPARTTIITGMYATALGAGNMRCSAVKPDGLKLLPELMREAGYYCTNASKQDYNLVDVDDVWDESSGKAHWKNGPDGKPFFAVFNYTKTHESKVRVRPHEKQIDPASVSLFPYWPDAPEVRQDWAQYLDNIQTMDGWFANHLKQLEDAGLSDDTIVIFWGDHGAGLARHKRYAGDSGMRVPLIAHVPEKWKKFWSSNYGAGARSDWPVGFVDLAPTVLSVAGAKIPDSMQGKSFLGADAKKTDYVFGIRNRMDERYDVSRSVTDGRFAYIRNFMPRLPHGQFVAYQQMTPSTKVWYDKFNNGELNDVQSAFWKPRAKEELYDLEADPHETVNLAGVEKHQAKLAELRTAVRSKMVAIGDLDLVPESVLYEHEKTSGKSRSTYSHRDGFDVGAIFDAAGGENALQNLSADAAEFRFWALVNITGQADRVTEELEGQIEGMLDDPSMDVRVKAAEFFLAQGLKCDRAIPTLISLADGRNSNFYVAGNALDCLDRYRDKLSAENMTTIRSLPTDFPEIKRSNNNLEKLMERFVEKKPRVLILGDSISIGYTPFVKQMLEAEADVFRPTKNGKPENCSGTDKGIKAIDRWLELEGGQWNVIHVNFGLHDLKHVDASGKNSNKASDPQQSNPEDYQRQFGEILEKIKATGAKVVVCTTTPVPPGCKPLRETTAPATYNAIAEKLAAEHGFAVNDLFAFANAKLDEIQKPANVHFTDKGSEYLADAVVEAIRKQLEK